MSNLVAVVLVDLLIVVPLLIKARRKHGLVLFYAAIGSAIAPLLVIGLAINDGGGGVANGLGTAIVVVVGSLVAIANLLAGVAVYLMTAKKPEEPQHTQIVGLD